jgi:DNA helicase-2/ATP-dependent DNA helicase PcrA
MSEDNHMDRIRLLDEFLGDIGKRKIIKGKYEAYRPENEFDQLSIEDYLPVEITEEVEEKILHLQKIAFEIDNRPQVTVDKSLLSESFKVDYLNSLNDQQLAAVVNTEGPVLVIAGAGTGKTRIIVYRVSYLIEKGINPHQILLLTFTRKAAREMLDRVAGLLSDKNAGDVSGSTFHSFANMVLRRYSNLLGIPAKFTILDQGDSEDVVDMIRSELKYTRSSKAFPKKRRIYEIISSARNRMMTIGEVIKKDFTGLIDYIPDIELIYSGYTKYKKLTHTLDYDDLMEILLECLQKNAAFREKLQDQFGYIMVDEYQDTNLVQKEIVDLLAGTRRNVMVVGDDFQSIYSFRGANYENILRFPEIYPDCQVIKIEENYRSNQNLLRFTNSINHSSRIGYKKQLFSNLNSESVPRIKKFYDPFTEAEFVVDRILDLREEGVHLNDIAVLVRAAWHWRYVELEFNKRSIPYVTFGGIKFNERRHIKDLVAYLKILLNPFDAVAWNRVLKLLPGIGNATGSIITRKILNDQGELILNHYNRRQFYHELERLKSAMDQATSTKITLKKRIDILKNYYTPILQSVENDFRVRLLDIDVLRDMATKYDDLEKFLSELSLDPPSRQFSKQTTPAIDEDEEGRVVISTVHSAKGLEWHTVFISHCLDGLFPNSKSLNHIEDLEEERRLFYVASSRSKKGLYITMPSRVSNYTGFFSYPSRFLLEIDRNHYELIE